MEWFLSCIEQIQKGKMADGINPCFHFTLFQFKKLTIGLLFYDF